MERPLETATPGAKHPAIVESLYQLETTLGMFYKRHMENIRDE